MIKNINLEFYQFILLIIMIFFTAYVWIKSVIKCSNEKKKFQELYKENKNLKKYILYIQSNSNYNLNYNSKHNDKPNIIY
jgi:hypothetical protein